MDLPKLIRSTLLVNIESEFIRGRIDLAIQRMPKNDDEGIKRISLNSKYYFSSGQYLNGLKCLPSIKFTDVQKRSNIANTYCFYANAYYQYEIVGDNTRALEYLNEAEKYIKLCSDSNEYYLMLFILNWRKASIYAALNERINADYCFQYAMLISEILEYGHSDCIIKYSKAWYEFSVGNRYNAYDAILEAMYLNKFNNQNLRYMEAELATALLYFSRNNKGDITFINRDIAAMVTRQTINGIGHGYIRVPYMRTIIKLDDLAYRESMNRDYTSRYKMNDILFSNEVVKCEICGSYNDLTVDHIFPQSLGGNSNVTNLRILCRRCNSRKKDRIVIYDQNAYNSLKSSIHR